MTVPNAEEWAALEDAALVEQARTDQAAFGALYERYVQKVYNYIYYRTGSHEDAEDLTARVFHRGMALPHCTQLGGELASGSQPP